MEVLTGTLAAANVPPSINPPGGLAPSNTPQIVLLTFDDSVTLSSYDLVQQVLTNHCNPNGDAIKATFFVALNAGYDFYAIRKLYDAGHEIAVHTMSHATDHNTTLKRWRQEIAGTQRTLTKLSGIPAEEITGFRAPRVDPNDHSFHVLHERQFRYDASMREALGGLSISPSNLIWPYTLDNGLAQIAQPQNMPATNYPGLFEIPIWVQFTNTTALALTDPPSTLSSNEVVALWKENFLSRYNGNRAPYGIFLHAVWDTQWLSNPQHKEWRVGALNEFINWALQQPDTWFITCNDLIDYMLDPVPAAAAESHPAFQTPQRTPFPEAEVVECHFPSKHVFSTCGVQPLFAPEYSNAYLGPVWQSSDAVAINIVSQNTQIAWCQMVVSNNTPYQISDWDLSCNFSGGDIIALYDATWSYSNGSLTAVARHYNKIIPNNALHTLNFRVNRAGGEVNFSDLSFNVQSIGPQQVKLHIQTISENNNIRLSWDDNAYIYSVECSTNLNESSSWSVIANELVRPEIFIPRNSSKKPHFFRVKGELYLE